MSVEDRKERDLSVGVLRAHGCNLLLGEPWFLQVQHDADPVLVVVARNAVVRVRSVGLDHALRLLRQLRRVDRRDLLSIFRHLRLRQSFVLRALTLLVVIRT